MMGFPLFNCAVPDLALGHDRGRIAPRTRDKTGQHQTFWAVMPLGRSSARVSCD